MPKRNAPPTRTSEEWRAISRLAARLGMLIPEVDEEEQDEDEEGHPDPEGEACGRAAELLIQSGFERLAPKVQTILEDETARLIEGGTHGWEAARLALKAAGVPE